MQTPLLTESLLSIAEKDPFAFYEAARALGPVVWDERMQSWLVLSAECCKQVELDEEAFHNGYRDAPADVIEVKGGRRVITLLHGPEHIRMRQFHMTLFTRQALAAYRERDVLPVLHHLLDKLAGRTHADLATELCDKLPTRVIASLLGLPWRDDALMERAFHLHQEIALWIGLRYVDPTLDERALAASRKLNEMLHPYVLSARDASGDDLMGRIWREAPAMIDNFSTEDAVSVCREIFFGGSDTSVHAIANALYLALTDPVARCTVEQGEPATLSAFVEEALRLLGSIQYRTRVARHDRRLGGVDIKSGDRLTLLHAAANRDGAVYECPANLSLARPRPQDHFAFNKGPRTCVGAGLARAEIESTVTGVLARLRNIRFDPHAKRPIFSGFYVRSYRPLNVQFDAVEAV